MIIRLIVWNEGPSYNKFDIKIRGCPGREAALCRAGTAVNAEADSKLAQGLRISNCLCSALSGPSASNPTPAQDSEKMVKGGTERTGEPADGEECCACLLQELTAAVVTCTPSGQDQSTFQLH